MGGSQSTRKLSVDNDVAIQVSQDALNRIQGQISGNQTEQPSPLPNYAPPPVYDSQRHAAEEAYWAQRIENLKRAHEKIHSGMQIEYQKTLKEANELFDLVKADKFANKLPLCQEEKAKVLECYKSNPNQTLLCSAVVKQFNDCVCKSRIAAVEAN